MSLIKDFKAFALRGNMVDLAVAVVIGAAFGKVVSALVDGILMPLIGLVLGGIDISAQSFVVGQAVIKWGYFLQALIDFAIIAFAVFIMLKAIMRLKKPEPAPVAKEIELLSEIRDLLKK